MALIKRNIDEQMYGKHHVELAKESRQVRQEAGYNVTSLKNVASVLHSLVQELTLSRDEVSRMTQIGNNLGDMTDQEKKRLRETAARAGEKLMSISQALS